jgi:hypothetical protein
VIILTVDQYFTEIAEELKRQSDGIRSSFSTHALSAGENREDLVADFLRNYLPRAFGIDTGLILSSEGQFSNQADLVIVDQFYNAPLYPNHSNKIWLVESVYAMIEVKTTLNPDTIRDSISKCIRFKRLKRNFQALPDKQKITESLFVLWAFNGPSNQTIKQNITDVLKNVEVDDHPDFILIPNRTLITAVRIVGWQSLGCQEVNINK